MYHQVTELYFKLVLSEMEQIALQEHFKDDFFLNRLQRINRYFRLLIQSFQVMSSGMEREQFMKFRMALLPASGFQSVQFRMIEICATDFKFLVNNDFFRQIDTHTTVAEMYEQVYWKTGATELATGKKTLTLKQFEDKYAAKLLRLAVQYQDCNLWRLFKKRSSQSQAITEALRTFDALVNVDWRLAHLSSAIKYLQRDTDTLAATGGTNWQKYLPPKSQQRMFFPELWTDQEKDEWGKKWVVEQLGKQANESWKTAKNKGNGRGGWHLILL